MTSPPIVSPAIAPTFAAPQHVPRPLPLFLELLRSETAGDPTRMARALAGLRAYQTAPRAAPRPPRPEIARVGRAVLRDCGGSGPTVLFVPSLINPPEVLDLAPGRSLVEHIAGCGRRVLLVDWGTPSAQERDLSIAGHVEQLLAPLIDTIAGPPPSLVGYCLGGTMAIGLAAIRPVEALALIAAPWRFSGFGEAVRARIDAIWEASAPLAEQLGYLPMEVLQSGFWQLDPARTITKFERFGELDPASPEAASFVELEDWANGGAPLSFGAAREMIDDLFDADITGRGRWQVAGRTVDPAALGCPLLEIVSTTDRIVPAASSAGVGLGIRLSQGHVGMVVGRGARQGLWEPLAAWLADPAGTVSGQPPAAIAHEEPVS